MFSNRGYNRTFVTAVVKTEVNKIKGQGKGRCLEEVTTYVKTKVTAEVKPRGTANSQSESERYREAKVQKRSQQMPK